MIETPGLDGTRVIVLTTYDTDENIYDALDAGASGFLLKDSGPDELLHAIHVVAAGEALLAPSVTRRLIAQFTTARTRHRTLPAALTDREREILAHVGLGLSNTEIAARLYLSPATVRTHVTRAMTNLHAHDRA